jgi:UPF0716 family protein affecting phage T7 exclusion
MGNVTSVFVRYVIQHPLRSLGHFCSGILLLVPGVVTTPLLALVGFSGTGVVAGKFLMDKEQQ